ncbi:MAG: hypothetical protein MI861_16915, partial [Pirellulales bacterium]|nr:hypothetical protein [Pirellulales bacterium]
AIQQARWSTAPTAGNPATLLVDVANHSSDTRQVKCKLELQSLVRTVEGTLEARSRSTLQINVDWPEAGWQWGRIELIDTNDSLPSDDVLPIAIGVRPETRLALVTEAESQSGNGTFFIRQALARAASPLSEEDLEDSRLAIVSPTTLDTPAAQAASLWIISDVEQWDDSVAPRVASWLRRGKAVLYVARGPADANNLRVLRETLGREMQPPVELVASLESDRRRDLRVEEFDQLNAPFDAFGDSLLRTAASWRIGGGSPTRSLDNATIDSIAAILSDRSVLLYFTDVGAGQLAVLNADLSASNLVFQAGFVPMLVETIGRLTDSGGALLSTPSGQALVRDLPADVGAETLSIVRSAADPEQATEAGRIQTQDSLLVWNWPATTSPDVYRVVDQTGRTLWAEAVRSDPSEQDLRSLSQQVLQQRLAGGRELSYQTGGQAPEQTDTLWVWAALAMLGCLVAETSTLLWFKS